MIMRNDFEEGCILGRYQNRKAFNAAKEGRKCFVVSVREPVLNPANMRRYSSALFVGRRAGYDKAESLRRIGDRYAGKSNPVLYRVIITPKGD